MAMWVMMHPVHWAILATLALLASRAAAVDCQQLANSTEGCDFYTQCLEVESPCGPQGYALGYGDKYCVRFGEYSDLFDEAVSPGSFFSSFNTVLCRCVFCRDKNG